MFKFKKPQKDKIYKIVYETSQWSRNSSMTLIVAAEDPTSAIKEFYNIAEKGVTNILEFVEVIPKKEGEQI